jgi:hypothetical protein
LQNKTTNKQQTKIKNKPKTKTKKNNKKEQKTHTVGTVPNSNRSNVETESKSTRIHGHLLSFSSTGTSIKVAGIS